MRPLKQQTASTNQPRPRCGDKVMANCEKPVAPEPPTATDSASNPTTVSTRLVTLNAVKLLSKPCQPRQRRPAINETYALPAPIRTFPLPPFHPTNPVSLVLLVSAWVAQILSPPVEPSVVYDGVWYPESRSVHVRDEKSMRALWEQGFYGKGSLSRSEPHWLERQTTSGDSKNKVSEQLTAQRREERRRTKWERARAQQEVIAQTRRREEATSSPRKASLDGSHDGPANSAPIPSEKPPAGSFELFAPPNSQDEAKQRRYRNPPDFKEASSEPTTESLLIKEDRKGKATAPSVVEEVSSNGYTPMPNGSMPSSGAPKIPPTGPVSDSCLSDDSKSLKRQKSVRFSPNVESTTYKLSDPPNPNAPAPSLFSSVLSSTSDWLWSFIPANQSSRHVRRISQRALEIENKEHLQLMPEEAFFLAFAFGALRILDPSTKEALPLERVFNLFRRHSYFPPRTSEATELRPDDPFLVHYTVYHHFRSMGWCVRPGMKFGVDWLLYLRGPIFNHAEFGILVLPSYSDEWWKNAGQQPPQRPWTWLTGITRTLSQVYKTLVLVYVEIPPPPVFEAALCKEGLSGAFGAFKVREMMVKRWLHNRNRSLTDAKWQGKPS